ncbi:hypothetical protein LOTGIDRAFT_233338 [Lottia gigantea]|uniref:Condensin complex subunit 1 C-terminal domain-containing protein n=1 Tax=Lottia gigantea TaxID=225164 RepID=V4AEG2_LOTGI|nr:hypothetical protein LOTGIDRAFT_233338 [Lottia gigantea]ESO91741.1 hypothetical protein LOTGIDRAFT_233338 [Lottia gigantea]
MIDSDRIIAAFSALPINSINQDWVKDVWTADFTDLGEIPEETVTIVSNDRYNISQLEDCCKLLVKEKDGRLWTLLVDNDISLKSTVVLLYYLLDIGTKVNSNYVMKEASILAASVYIKLLALPGSGAFKVFHPEIIVKCVEILKFFDNVGSTKRKVSSDSGGSKKKKGQKKRKRKNTAEEDSSLNNDEDVSINDDDDIDEELTPSQVNRLMKLLLNLLKDLTHLFEGFSLKSSYSTAHRLISYFVQLTRQEMVDVDFYSWPSIENMSVPCLAYRCLDLMCTVPSLNITILTAVCKYILPNLLMAGKSVVRADTKIVDQTVEFLRYIMKTGGETTIPVISTLIQHMSTKVLDKSDFRLTVAKAIVTLLQDFPAPSYSKVLEWLLKLSQHAKMSHRIFALEVVTLLLGRKEPESIDDVNDETVLITKHKSLMSVILARCSDLSPSVRSKAILGFSQCFVSLNTDVVSAMREIVTPRANASRQKHPPHLIPTPDLQNRVETRITPESISKDGENETPLVTPSDSDVNVTVGNTTSTSRNRTVFPFTPFVGVQLTPGFNPDLTDNEGVISMLRRRSSDENAGVRKAAVQALQNIILFEKPNFRKENLIMINERCCDPSLSVRKQSIQCLTRYITQIWLDGALPLVMDRENTLQDKCCELVEDVIFGNLTTYHKHYLQLACQTLARSKKIKLSYMKNLETHIDTENNKGAWLLIYIIAQFVPKINAQFVIDYWEKHSQSLKDEEEDTFERVLNVICYTAEHLLSTVRLDMIDDLNNRLKRFDSPPGLVAVIVKTLSKLSECQATSEGDTTRSQKETWGVQLLKSCDEYLSKVIFEDKLEGEVDEDKIVCYLSTIGEIVQLCPAKTPQRIYLLVQSIVAGSELPSEHHSQISDTSHTSSQNSSQNSSQSSQGTQQAIPPSQPFSQFKGFNTSNRVRTFAFITLGKLLLQNERLAKKCIPALARELETCSDIVLRNNIVIIMCDLCIRYTTVIDSYVPNIAVCLKDRAPLIRKQTLTLLTRLLQEDFIKWKGVLFFRFITTLLDSDSDIQDFAEFCMINILLHRQPNMFFNHFIECIFHFNGYTESSVYNKFTQTDREKSLFNMKGEHAASKRLKLYLFMLEHTNDQHKFQLTSKLCQDILGGVVDNILPLNEKSLPLLKDSLAILSSKEIKISSMKAKPTAQDDDEQQPDMAAVVLATAKKHLITQVVKKNVIENIVPIVTSLKYILEKEKSPVLKDLMIYLQVLMKDFKTEIEEILASDKQLLKELNFDIKRFEEQQENESNNITTDTIPMASQTGTPVATPVTIVTEPSSDNNTDTTVNSPSRTDSTTTQTSTVGTPKQDKITGPRPPLLSAAILNSAKKNIERLKELKEARNTPSKTKKTPKGKTPSNKSKGGTPVSDKERRKSGVTWADENSKDPIGSSSNTNEASSTSSATILIKTPNHRVTRAISTPSGALGNITFAIDQNTSMIPLSPIEGSDESALQISKQPEFDSDDVVFLMSPERPLPKPKKWNIKSVKTEAS